LNPQQNEERRISTPLPFPPSIPWWISMIGTFTWVFDRIGDQFRLQQRYGDIVMIRFATLRLYFIYHPDLIQECLVTRHKDFHKSSLYYYLKLVLGQGLVTSEDEFHMRQRRMMQPAFHRERVRDYGKAMVEHAAQARDSYREGEAIDLNRDMMRVTLNIVGRALFGADLSAEVDRVGHAMDALLRMDYIFLNPFAPLIARLPIPVNRTRKAMTAELDDVLYRMIAQHRASGDTGDLLSMLLAARDEDDNTGMTDKQVRDEAVTLFLAGHETTASVLTFAWHLLSQHPAEEARFHEELDRVLNGRTPTPDDYPALAYTRQIVAESMRLYPPAWMFAREATCDTQLGGYAVPKGTQIIISSYVAQHDPRWHPDPEAFNPDRFTEEATAARPKFAFFPFGGGNRLCIGEGFAWMEAVLVLATIGQKWKFHHPDGKPLKLDPRVTLRPKGGLRMVPVER
jgi:cytochrome P450